MASDLGDLLKTLLDKFFDWKGVAALLAMAAGLMYCLRGPSGFPLHVAKADDDHIMLIILAVMLFSATWLACLVVEQIVLASRSRAQRRAADGANKRAWSEQQEALENLHELEAAILYPFLAPGQLRMPMTENQFTDRLLRNYIIAHEGAGWYRLTPGVREWLQGHAALVKAKAEEATRQMMGNYQGPGTPPAKKG